MKRFLILLCLSIQPVMAADLSALHVKVKAICPIVGISGNPADIQKLRIDFAPEATETQKRAARDFVKSLRVDSPEIQAPNLDGFLEECLASEVFTTQELVQILYCERQKDQSKRDALILRLVVKAPQERQVKIKALAEKYHISLPQW